jgi:TonB family protein
MENTFRGTTMNHVFRLLVLVITATLAGFSFQVSAQTHTNSEKQSTRAEESKGEVDHMVEELSKKSEAILRRCLEKCDDTSGQTGQNVKVGNIINKATPAYPPLARTAHVSGEVVVMVLVDEKGKVVAAQAQSGHPLLLAAAVTAARDTTFAPTLMDGKPTKVMGTISYNFRL